MTYRNMNRANTYHVNLKAHNNMPIISTALICNMLLGQLVQYLKTMIIF